MPDYDVIVIGSGAGGLASAVSLANAGKRVLVLEQHYMAGGWMHSFVLDGYKFSPGVHYIGRLKRGESLHNIYQGLGISGDLEFCELNPEGFEHIRVDGEAFDVPADKQRWMMRLIEQYPHEEVGIRAFFDTMTKVATQVGIFMQSKGWQKLLLPFRCWTLIKHARRTMKSVLETYIQDPVVRVILMVQAGDYALAPSRAPVIQHAMLMEHYWGGAHYPRGGAHRIPRAFIRQLKRKGGKIRLSTPVRRILLQDGTACGVELDGGEQISAEVVISNADPAMTFQRLLAGETLPAPINKKLQHLEYSISTVSLFLATDLDLKALGFDSGNYWNFAHTDLEKMYDTQNDELPESFDVTFVTCTTLKDPSRFQGHHTIEVFGFSPYAPFAQWGKKKSGERGEAYEALKMQVTERLLNALERLIPNIREHIVFQETGTPLTNKYYCESHEGSIYGIAKIGTQFGPGAFPARSAIPNLWMVGSSTIVGHGIMGATASGVYAAAEILNCPVEDLFTEAGPPIPLYPADAPETWLDELRSRRNATTETDEALDDEDDLALLQASSETTKSASPAL